MPDDGTLVARVLDGDDGSFALLFRRHATAVHTFAQRRTRSVDLADDITAAAFEKAWRALDKLGAQHGERFRPWLFRIAANEMATLMRSRSRRRQREHLAAMRGEGAVDRDRADGLAAIDASSDVETILDALGELPPRYQEVISLRYLSDLTAAETATAMGISRGNVAVLLHRAIAALRTRMEDRS
ncbi:MAG: RNA polymerase sigma factor [Ilumatobacter sp.]|nr:RNA polymerase sigma factor [Ilumatobacter sp.]